MAIAVRPTTRRFVLCRFFLRALLRFGILEALGQLSDLLSTRFVGALLPRSLAVVDVFVVVRVPRVYVLMLRLLRLLRLATVGFFFPRFTRFQYRAPSFGVDQGFSACS